MSFEDIRIFSWWMEDFIIILKMLPLDLVLWGSPPDTFPSVLCNVLPLNYQVSIYSSMQIDSESYTISRDGFQFNSNRSWIDLACIRWKRLVDWYFSIIIYLLSVWSGNRGHYPLPLKLNPSSILYSWIPTVHVSLSSKYIAWMLERLNASFNFPQFWLCLLIPFLLHASCFIFPASCFLLHISCYITSLGLPS